MKLGEQNKKILPDHFQLGFNERRYSNKNSTSIASPWTIPYQMSIEVREYHPWRLGDILKTIKDHPTENDVSLR
ncbi:hypothetical protein LARV_01299 [Longilinea arvoryzae]|uniref:Uncharacterized protein n=1 Tax=Longilinea arvoryzae TaxID=360412 RepID=A0A0S7BH76_9CHLR|nr:hypothetical protein LARV_01299 [Longilinea arvoryzae]